MGRKDAINLPWLLVGYTVLLESTWVVQVFDRNGGGRALASCGDCRVLSPGMLWGREKLGAQSVETISTLTRRLLPLVRVVAPSQPSATTPSPAWLPCTLLKGLSNTTYYSGLLLFPLESGAAPPCPVQVWVPVNLHSLRGAGKSTLERQHLHGSGTLHHHLYPLSIPSLLFFKNKMRPGD